MEFISSRDSFKNMHTQKQYAWSVGRQPSYWQFVQRQEAILANKPNSIDAYKAVFSAGDNAYHVVKSLQENSLDEVISATMRDIQSERPDLYEIDARIQACLEVKCTLAAATGRGRGKRVRAALAEKKAKQVQTTPITNIQANLVKP